MNYINRTGQDAVIAMVVIVITAFACSHVQAEDLVARGIELNRAEALAYCRSRPAFQAYAAKDAASERLAKADLAVCEIMVDSACVNAVMCAAQVASIRSDEFALPVERWRQLDVTILRSDRQGIEYTVQTKKQCRLQRGTQVAVIGRSPVIVMGRSLEDLNCVAWL